MLKKNIYLLTVFTSDIHNAGTDANVWVELISRKSSSGRIPLKDSLTNQNPFERGKKDKFEIRCLDLGNIKKLRIGHDNRGFNSAWNLDKVIVKSQLDDRKWIFEFRRWLAKDKQDGKIEVELDSIEITNDYLNIDHKKEQIGPHYYNKHFQLNDGDDFSTKKNNRSYEEEVGNNRDIFKENSNELKERSRSPSFDRNFYRVELKTSNTFGAGTVMFDLLLNKSCIYLS
jgi:hypothetical protein